MSEWKPSETKPGYRTKTLQHGGCTIVINRPILTPEEQKKREDQVIRNVELALRNYCKSKESKP